ncbi:MAG: type II toxin-antitoxin system RelE/ParE family toxin [Synergistaceae bacterium]|nr:type II toxin-antitoxin system RelE/ParE family toxin [Synergistaceae bacterium]MBR0095472.1 type II toxin-antitoxin system RelE/ParE family toxin [Synergistaceae bacterium]
MWTVNVDEAVWDRLAKIPNPDKRRITQAIYGLEDDLGSLDIKKLKGRSGYRLRVGKWRIIMDIDKEEKVIFVYFLASRGEVYKNKNQ